MMAGENSDLSILQKNFQAWLDAYNARDLDEYFSHYHEDVLLFGYGPEPFNKANVRSWYENMYDHFDMSSVLELSLIHISEPTRLRRISYAVF